MDSAASVGQDSRDSIQSSYNTEEIKEKDGGRDVECLEVTEEDDDAVWGKGSKFKTLGWGGAFVICLKIQLGLGVLSIPKVLATLGYVPGVLIIVILGALTTWSSVILGQTKKIHPEIASVGDWGYVIGSPVTADVITVVYILCKILDGAAAYTSLSIGLNVISYHGLCTVAIIGLVSLAAFLLASIQTLQKISILGWIALVAIMSAILTATVAIGLEQRPALAPINVPFSSIKELNAFGKPSFVEALSSAGSVLFAYAGIPIYMNVLTEMKRPQDYNKAVLGAQGFVTVIYLSLGIVIYYYAGQFVSSPSLGTPGLHLARICYGLALPGLMMSSLIFTHVSSKTLFIRILRNSRHLTASTKTHYGIWYSCVAAIATSSFLVAAGVPTFGGLVDLSGSLLGSFLTLVLPGMMWLYDNDPRVSGRPKKTLTVALAVVMIIIGLFLMTAGAYASGEIIKDSIQSSKGSFTCRDNSK